MPTSTATTTPLSTNPLTKGDARAGRRQPSWKCGQGWIWAAQVHHVPELTQPLPVFSVQSWLREELSEVQRAAVLSVAAGYL